MSVKWEMSPVETMKMAKKSPELKERYEQLNKLSTGHVYGEIDLGRQTFTFKMESRLDLPDKFRKPTMKALEACIDSIKSNDQD